VNTVKKVGHRNIIFAKMAPQPDATVSYVFDPDFEVPLVLAPDGIVFELANAFFLQSI
jgi:hypothetical protein